MTPINLVGVRTLVQAAFAAGLEFKMLDCIGDEYLAAVDAGVRERPGENATGGPDERMPLLVLLIARLLADHHHARMRRSFAGHHLRGIAIQRAACAPGFRRAQHLERFDDNVVFGHAGVSVAAATASPCRGSAIVS